MSNVTATLRIPQVRILKALAKSSEGLTRVQIAARAKVSLSMTANLGPVKHEEIASVNGWSGKRCLWGLRYVKVSKTDVDGKDVLYYSITESGRKALEALRSA